MWNRTSWRALALALALIAVASRAAAQDYALDVSVAASAKAATFQVPSAGGSIPLTLLNTGKAAAGDISIHVTPFLSDAGERIEPQLAAGAQRSTTVTLTTADLVSCELVVPALPGAGPFTGSLIIRTGEGAPTRQVVAITPTTASRPAVLHVMPEAETKPFVIRRPFFRSHVSPPAELDASLGPTFDIRLGDAALKWPVNQVDIGPLTILKSPDGFGGSDVAFYDAAHRRVTFPRTIPASGETLTLQLLNLVAGEYSATIPFQSANGATEPTRFTFTANVKHDWTWAVLCVSVALLLSFAASKLVDIRNERMRLTRRIEQLSPAWLRQEEQTLAIVWVICILSQARKHSRRWLLPGLDTIHARLDKVEALLPLLGSLRRARSEIISSQALTRFAKTRVLTLVRRIAEAIDPELDLAVLNEQAPRIAALRDWTRGDPAIPYKADLTVSVDQLLGNVEVAAIPTEGQNLVRELLQELDSALPDGLRELEIREQQYARLKILWERRKANEFPQLLSAANGPIEQLFAAADTAAWERLERAKKRITCSATGRTDAQDPIIFSFSTDDAELNETYFVKHALRYEWHFDLIGKKRRTERQFHTEATTNAPRVPQFALFPGTLRPVVAVFFGNSVQKANGAPITISRNSAFNALNGFSVGEMVQLGLAFVAAVTTGLQTFYFKAGGFGSLPDYLTLFAWGATIDQLKNFLQKLPTSQQSIQGAAASTTPSGQTPVPTSAAAGKTAAPTPTSTTGTPAPPATPSPAPAVTPPEIPEPNTPPSLPLNGETSAELVEPRP
jgi:hypothetical protein